MTKADTQSTNSGIELDPAEKANYLERSRVLLLYRYLKVHSDVEHPVTTQELIAALNCQRRAVYAAADALAFVLNGTDGERRVMNKCRLGKMSAYYIDERPLTRAQTRFLIDAVKAAPCFTKEQTSRTVNAIVSVYDEKLRDFWSQEVPGLSYNKSTGNGALDNVEVLDRALAERRQISYGYFTYSDGVYVARPCKNRNPLELIFNNGYYYLCLRNSVGQIYSVRVDKMTDIVIEKKRVPISVAPPSAEEVKQLMRFSMWGGNGALDKIRFSLPQVYHPEVVEKFGEINCVLNAATGEYTYTAEVYLSDVFWGWCAGYGDHIKILDKSTRQKYLDWLQRIVDCYK